MSESLFEDLPILDELGFALRDGMARVERGAASAAPARRRRLPRFLGTFLVLGLVGTTAAAGTLTVLRGSPIPGPSAEDTQPSMVQRADSQEVLSLRATDPAAGRLPFALRVGESEDGNICATVGQADGSDFGIVGEDGRFRQLPAGIVDSCGRPTGTDAAVAGARVLDAKRYEDVRTVVYGAGADDLERATLIARGKTTELKVEDGAFIGVVPTYPEDVGLQLRLKIGDRTVTHRFGTGPTLVLDPSGPAWQLSRGGGSSGMKAPRRQSDCVNLQQVRRQGNRTSSSPLVCFSAPVVAHQLAKMPAPVLYNARTFRTGDKSAPSKGNYPSAWQWNAAARTAVWGMVDRKLVRRVELLTPDGKRERLRITLNSAFGAVLAASTPASDVRLLVSMKNGSTRTYSRPVIPSTSMQP